MVRNTGGGNLIDLKSIRHALHKSQSEIAKAAGISQQYYALLEAKQRGKKLPVPTAKRLANTMGFDWQLLYEE